jgi:hypothetical protein
MDEAPTVNTGKKEARCNRADHSLRARCMHRWQHLNGPRDCIALQQAKQKDALLSTNNHATRRQQNPFATGSIGISTARHFRQRRQSARSHANVISPPATYPIEICSTPRTKPAFLRWLKVKYTLLQWPGHVADLAIGEIDIPPKGRACAPATIVAMANPIQRRLARHLNSAGFA